MRPAEAKAHCGYQDKPVQRICSTCGSFAFDMDYPKWVLERVAEGRDKEPIGAPIECRLRCTDHGFATKKTATCRLWRVRFEA